MIRESLIALSLTTLPASCDKEKPMTLRVADGVVVKQAGYDVLLGPVIRRSFDDESARFLTVVRAAPKDRTDQLTCLVIAQNGELVGASIVMIEEQRVVEVQMDVPNTVTGKMHCKINLMEQLK